MADTTRQIPDKRDQFKCTECRRKKIKCKPRNRQWDVTHQKCENCNKHDDAPCGPSYKKRDDPAFAKSRNNVIAHEEEIAGDAEDQPRASIPRPAGTAHSSVYDQHSPVTEEPSGQLKRIKLAPDKELSEEARCKLRDLNSLGIIHEFASMLTRISCRAPDRPTNFNELPDHVTDTIRAELHSLFMAICKTGLQLHELEKDDIAHAILTKLVLTLEKYPGLCDPQKSGALLKIAKFYEDIGDQDEMEWVLGIAAQTHNASALHENPCQLLVQSLLENSNRARDVLLKLWQNKFMVDGEASLAIPPIQRSAQYSVAGVTSTMLAQTTSDTHSAPALFNLQGIHVAALLGSKENVVNFLQAGVQVDVLDLHNHTALFLAAAKGHEECCAALITKGANPNGRDRHGTTILEAAVRAGYLKIVMLLVNAGAEINPHLICCGSSPLQAAVESLESPDGFVFYLLENNADVTFQRRDGKNAIDLAEERKLWALALTMREKQQQGAQGLFEQGPSFPFDINY